MQWNWKFSKAYMIKNSSGCDLILRAFVGEPFCFLSHLMSVNTWWECDNEGNILGENVFFFSPLAMGRRSFMNEGTWPNTMTSGFDTRERNQQGEHELASGSANASVSEPTFNRCPWCLLAVGTVPGEETDGDNRGERHFLQPGGSANQTESVLLCWVCMLADKLRLASRASMPSSSSSS